MNISDIIDSIHNNKVRVSDHADEESIEDNLSLNEILFSVINGEIIEDYPNDKPFPSCLILGYNKIKEPIHSVWAYNEINKWSVLITVYRPDEFLCIDYRFRRT
ncbi:MAG: DUF4258 domain-containing protein [Ignavibacteriae bacterium]|nr:DUF4258 domain-containing protein [Ignavibacteriota bacterium]